MLERLFLPARRRGGEDAHRGVETEGRVYGLASRSKPRR